MSETVLSVRNLTVSFGGLVAVDDLSFDVQDGQLFGVIGPNGAGKSTLLNAVSGVTRSKGEVFLLGRNASGLRADKMARRGLARTFQSADFFSEFSVLDSLAVGRWQFASQSMFAAMFSLPPSRRPQRANEMAAMAALEEVGLADHADVLLSEVSYGTRKVLDVLRATLMEPKVLMLDEPTSGTTASDREQLRTLVRAIRDRGIGIVLVDHDVSFIADVSDVAMAMNFGKKLGEGKPKELLEREDVRAAYVGLEEA
jgi:ABC-type branched-subunit amino acid transport system ATPase component